MNIIQTALSNLRKKSDEIFAPIRQSQTVRDINTYLRQPVPTKLQPLARSLEAYQNSTNPLVQLPQQLVSGYVQGANLGLGKPLAIAPRTGAEKFTNIIGSMGAYSNPYTASGRIVKTVSALTNPILSKAVNSVAGKGGTGLSKFIANNVSSGIANVGQGLIMNPALGQANTLGSMAIDLGIGTIAGPRQFDMPTSALNGIKKPQVELNSTEITRILKNTDYFNNGKIKLNPDGVPSDRAIAKEIVDIARKMYPETFSQGRISFQHAVDIARKVAQDNHNYRVQTNAFGNMPGMGLVDKTKTAGYKTIRTTGRIVGAPDGMAGQKALNTFRKSLSESALAGEAGKDLGNKLKDFISGNNLVSAQPWNTAGKQTPLQQFRQKTLKWAQPAAQKYQQFASTPISQTSAPVRFAVGAIEGLEPVRRYGQEVALYPQTLTQMGLQQMANNPKAPQFIRNANIKLADSIYNQRKNLGIEKPGLKTGVKVLSDTALTGMTAYGAAKLPLTLGSTALGTALGTGIGAVTGQDIPTAIGKSFVNSLTAQGLGRLTSPVIEPIVNKAAKYGGTKLMNQLAGRTAQGGLNIIEDEFYSRLNGIKPGLADQIASFGIGAIISPSANNALFNKVPLTPVEKVSVKKQLRDLKGRWAKEAGVKVKNFDYMVPSPDGRTMVAKSRLDKSVPGLMSDLEKINKYLNSREGGFMASEVRPVKDMSPAEMKVREGLTPEVTKSTIQMQDSPNLRSYNDTAGLVEQKTITKSPQLSSKSNISSPTNAFETNISLKSNSIPKPEEVAATLPSRLDNLINKTLNYSTENPTEGTSLPGLRTTREQLPASLTKILPQKQKLNVENLNLNQVQKEHIRNLQENVPLTVIGHKEIVEKAATAKPRVTKLTDAEQADMIARQLATRQSATSAEKAFDAAKKSGATELELKAAAEEVLSNSETATSYGTLAGRLLEAQKIMADELATPMQKVLATIQQAGVPKQKIVDAMINVDFNDTAQVLAFYRKMVPPKFGEILTEIRYTNMLSSPNTHINNMASNFLMTGIVRPVTKTLAGVMDWTKSALTGSERKYFASQGADYAKGYWSNLPKAWKNFSEQMRTGGLQSKPDLSGRMPVFTKGLGKLYTTPLRMLEASDQFFKTLTMSGEMRAGMKLADAEKSAQYLLFRQEFDPTGKLGQNVVLKTFDKWNSFLQGVRKQPGGNWIAPFLQTPTNILKQGFEFSPLGLTTVPGSKEPIEQLAKVAVGSTVFLGAYGLANSGLTTWSAPTNEKERDLFYAAGLQPYSIKMGNKWVSYSKLGPLSYPIAMAAAYKNVQERNPDQTKIEQLGNTLAGTLGFFADQSYVRSFGDFLDSVQTGRGISIDTLSKSAANLAGQLVPYESFMGWLTRIIDPNYKKPTGFTQQIASTLPGLSQNVPNRMTREGVPSQRDLPLVNAVSPARVSVEKPGQLPLYEAQKAKIIQLGVENRAGKKLESQGPGASTVAGKVYQYVDDAGEVKKVDLSPIEAPTLTGNYELDKKLKSSYNSKITAQTTAIAKLYEAGQLDAGTAEQMIRQLQSQKTTSAKKVTFKKPKKITLKKAKTVKSKVVKLKAPKLTKIKALKFKKLKQPKLKKLKTKKIKT